MKDNLIIQSRDFDSLSPKCPPATRLPTALSSSALNSLPNGSGRKKVVEVLSERIGNPRLLREARGVSFLTLDHEDLYTFTFRDVKSLIDQNQI